MHQDAVTLTRARKALWRLSYREEGHAKLNLNLSNDDNATEYVNLVCDDVLDGLYMMGPKGRAALRAWVAERIGSGEYIPGTAPQAQQIKFYADADNRAANPRAYPGDPPPEVSLTIARDGKRLQIDGSIDLLRDFLRTFERES